MPHSYSQIFIHLILNTKNRQPFIKPEIEKEIYVFLKQQLTNLGCSVDIVNGVQDHIHILFRMSPTKSISEIAKQVKGSSSHYINEKKLTEDHFEWKRGFGAFSVSAQGVNTVHNYIRNQKNRHS